MRLRVDRQRVPLTKLELVLLGEGLCGRDRFGGLVEDVQSPAWAAASGLCLIRHRAKSAEIKASMARAQGAGGFGALVSKFRNRFGGIF